MTAVCCGGVGDEIVGDEEGGRRLSCRRVAALLQLECQPWTPVSGPRACRNGMNPGLHLLLAAVPAVAPAQEPAVPSGSGPASAAPRAVWVTTAGRETHPLGGWADGAPVPADGARPAGAWLRLEFPDVRRVEPPPGAWRLELVDGSLLRGAPGHERVGDLPTWRLVAAAPPLPFDSLWLLRQGRDRLPPRAADEDVLWLRRPTGAVDEHRGWLLDWRPEGPEFEARAGVLEPSWEEVQALAVLGERVEEPTDVVWLEFADGGFLAARVLGWDAAAATLEVAPPWGGRWGVPLAALAGVRRRAGLVELADAPWLVRRAPEGTVLDWRPKRGRSVEGRPLSLAGRVCPDGWGVRAPSELALALDRPGTFAVTVGVDDEVRDFVDPAPVRFRVLLDDVELAATPPLGHGDRPRTLVVPLDRPGLLRLVAEPAGPRAAGTHADWCDLLLLPAGDGGGGRPR